MQKLSKILTLSLFAAFGAQANAADVYLSYNDVLYTVSLSGQVLNQVAVPADGSSITYSSDVAVMGDGSVVVRGGAAEGETYLYRNGAWSELVPPPSSNEGGAINTNDIGAYGTFVYTRAPSYSIPGVRRYKVENGRVTQTSTFSAGFTSPNNVRNPTAGQNGKLYAFEGIRTNGTFRYYIHELHNDSLQILKTIELPNYSVDGLGAFDVDAAGNVYYSSKQSVDGKYKSGVTKLNSSGAFVKSLAIVGQKFDIEIHQTDVLIANFDTIYVTDTNLSSLRPLLPTSFFSSSQRNKFVAFKVPSGPLPDSSSSIQCVLNNPTATNGGFGIHNSFVKNTSATSVSGWTKTIDFGNATPKVGWFWGVDARVSGNKILLSKAGSIAPGQSISFGLGGNYSGAAPSKLTCK